MKNLHILPTPKPSRLHYYYYFDGQPVYGLSTTNLSWRDGRHIYIINDEEIKVGDWVIEFQKGDNIGEVHFINGEYVIANDIQKKIIITTDIDLIKDSVQAIDDEFLEWFVKNPSCEEVEIKEKQHFQADKSKRKNPLNGVYYSYKIIIPKEESKQESVFENAKSSLKKYLFDNKEKVAKDLEQMRGWSNTDKQETLEEYIKEVLEDEFFTNISERSKSERLIRLGVGWQEERSDIKSNKIIEFLDNEAKLKISDTKTIERIKWYFEIYFEQFKKK